MDSSLYRRECLQQLSDSAFYRPLSSPLSGTSATVYDALQRLHHGGFISARELNFLQPPASPRELPKLHKFDKHRHDLPPGRPIVSDIGSSTYGVGKFVEHFLNPLARLNDSHLDDSLHLIARVAAVRLLDTSLLCSLDVRSLYTNIPVAAGIERVRRALRRHPDPKRPDTELLNLLSLSLTTNDFVFDGGHWQQISGVAMGKAFGGSFANVYLGEWETLALESAPHRPSFWVRYQDDVFMIWDHGRVLLEAFVDHLNLQDAHIQVDLAANADSLHFLDLELYRSCDRLAHRVAFKTTDRHLLLPKDSHHPRHTYRGVIFSQVLRWATHSCTPEGFRRACHEVFPLWRAQGATRSALRSAVRRVLSLTGQAADWTTGFFKCGGSHCQACSFAIERRRFRASNRWFPIVHRLTCDSTACVYVICCSSCGKRYVGQTSNSVRQRVSQHVRRILLRDSSSPLTEHFNSACSLRHLSFFAVERCLSTERRLIKEERWIVRLRTRRPFGLNLQAHQDSRVVNLVTTPADCADRLNAFIRRTCEAETGLRVRFAYRVDKNLRTTFL